MVEGLRTGAADLSQCGKITVADLYEYTHGQLMRLKNNRQQNPKIWSFDQEGNQLGLPAIRFFKLSLSLCRKKSKLLWTVRLPKCVWQQ